MLVLSRHPGEEIVIETPSGEVIVVRVEKASRHGTKIGIQAAPEVRIDRAETLPVGWTEGVRR